MKANHNTDGKEAKAKLAVVNIVKELFESKSQPAMEIIDKFKAVVNIVKELFESKSQLVGVF